MRGADCGMGAVFKTAPFWPLFNALAVRLPEFMLDVGELHCALRTF
jgi:hypothetical protein